MPKVTWGYMKEWAAGNNVTDDAVMYVEDFGDVSDLSFAPAIGGDDPVFSLESDGDEQA
jgi:hypothetical protein